ncbi:polyketide cyclase/dehydrase/lipid transport protein [Bacillus oleivorans]|uniref:Polyketide cyclase/dehydrase/lipid transport protein n=1 Tax=Bacillus oleivorans TaxID=1448271 RepID=A0A285CIE9_9BACI|nr:SRPBCC family protein [Bacillus oleivorans]SNX67289.1 polyketide cyclase/dehydrase/lipid transport protein [Bacillus oleivorans]
MIRNQVVIEKNQASVFERVVEAGHREHWMDEIQSINMEGPVRAGTKFIQNQIEGKRKTTYQGVIEKIEAPHYFSYKLISNAFDMRIGYELQGQGASTNVIQFYDVRYKSFFAKMMGTLFSGLMKRLARKQLDNLKEYCERG